MCLSTAGAWLALNLISSSPHHVTIIQHACTYNTRQQKHKQINLAQTKKSKHSEWTQWHEAKSGIDWLTEQGLTSPPTEYLSGRQFYRSKTQPTVSKYWRKKCCKHRKSKQHKFQQNSKHIHIQKHRKSTSLQ